MKTNFDRIKPTLAQLEFEKEDSRMKSPNQRRMTVVKAVAVFLCFLYASFSPAQAQYTHPDSNPMTNWDIRKTYFLRFPAAAQHGPAVDDNPEGHDEISDKKSQGPGTITHGPGPVFSWPVTIPTAVSSVPTLRDEAITMNLFQTFGYPVSDTQFQLIERYNQNRFLEQLYDPEKVMWLATSIGSIQSNSAGNSAGNMAVNQNVTAIEYCAASIANFTIDDGNVWNRLRNELFIPMAVLLLLPGAVLAQVRAIVAQGSPAIVGEVNPFEGIIRSIIAIFLIPGSYLVINYGIDVSNSIRYTIATEFQRIFGADMYDLAKCSIKRAYPINDPRSNRNAIEHSEEPHIEHHDVWSPYESLSLGLRLKDPCAGVDESRVPDEDVRQVKPVNRLLVNVAGAAEGATWNILCAFQVVFLYYLWCMGPIAAALSVWPVGALRDAFKNWCEGVIVVCFWTLFWNTIILLMAAFKGVGDTGTLYITALEMMAIQAVKSAFDFAGLVGSAAGMAESMANKAASNAASGGGGGGAASGGGQRSGAAGASGATAARGPGVESSSNATRTPMDGGGPVGSGGLMNSIGGGGSSGSGGGSISTGDAGQMKASITGGGGPGGGSGADGAGGSGRISADTGAPATDASSSGVGDGKGGPDPGLPPGMAGDSGTGDGGKGPGGGELAAAVGGIAAIGSGKAGEKAGGPPGSSNAQLSYSATVNKMGKAGDVSNSADMNLNKDLSNLPPAALMDAMTNSSTNLSKVDSAFERAVSGGEGLNNQLNKFDQSVLGDAATHLAGSPLNAADELGKAALPPDAGPLTGELGLNKLSSEFGQSDILPNGIDKDFAHDPQAQLARSAAQDLMNIDADPSQAGVQPLVSQDMLKDALNGDQAAISSIDQKLGVSPEVLNAALHGDSGSASLLLAASGHRALDDQGSALHKAAAEGNFAAIEALKVAPRTDEGTIMSAAHGNPVAAAQAFNDGADTQSWMASRDLARGELQNSGIAPDRFRDAMSGDQTAQMEISRSMGLGDNNFDVIRGAAGGDRQDAATMLAARGAEEMRHMSPEQIQQAVQSGDTSIMAARSVDPDVLSRAISGDADARQSIQSGLASDPGILQSASTGNFESLRAINAMTGERPDVLAAASSNAQSVMGMFADPNQVNEAMAGNPEQRQAFMDQVANQMQVSPHLLRDAVGGDTTASATLLAVAGHHGHVANLAREGNPLARMAMSTQQTVDIETLRAASTGNESAQFAVQNAIAMNPELANMAQSGSPEAISALHATRSVADGGGAALGREGGPLGPVYAASREAQATLTDLGVDPTAYVRGDAAAQNQVYEALNIDPQSPIGHSMHSTVDRALHGDAGAAATFMAASGRSERVQELARQGDFSAQAAVVAAHSVPDGVLHSAVAGNHGAQSYVQNELAVSPHMMSLAGQGNEQAIYAVQASHGSDAIGNISASSNTQNLMGYFADSTTVQTALYGQGADKAAAMTNIAGHMGVAPRVLDGAIHGSATLASVAFVKASQSEPVRTAAEAGDPLARAVQSTAAGQNMSVVEMAASGHVHAAEAVNQGIRESQMLQNLAIQGNPEAAGIRAVSGNVENPNRFVSSQEALSRNLVEPVAPAQIGTNPSTAYEIPTSGAGGSWGDFVGGSTSVNYSAEAYRGANETSYIAQAANGSNIVIDSLASTFIPASANLSMGHSIASGSQSLAREEGQANYTVNNPQPQYDRGNVENLSGGSAQTYQVVDQGAGQPGYVDPGSTSQYYNQADNTQANYTVDGSQPVHRDGNVENLGRTSYSEPGYTQPTGSVGSEGLSTGGASPYSRIHDAAPQSPHVEGGFSGGGHTAAAQPPESQVNYGSGQTGGADRVDQGQNYLASNTSDLSSNLRPEADPGMLSQDAPSSSNYGRSSLEGGGDLIAYNQGSGSGQQSSLGKTLRDALPGAGAGFLAGGAAKPESGGGGPTQGADPAQTEATQRAEMNRLSGDRLRTSQAEAEKRRRAEEERVRQADEKAREQKKADYKRYRDKVDSERKRLESEAERRAREEEGE